MKPTKYSAPALEKGLDLLECLSGSNLPLNQAELARELGRSHSEIFRMLGCLEQRGYIQRDSSTGKYRLTLKVYAMGLRQNALSMLRRAAVVPMEELAAAVGQSCHLSMLHDNQVVAVMERLPPRTVCCAVGEGTSTPVSVTTSGRLLLSRLPEEHADAVLRKDTHYTKASARRQQDVRRIVCRARKDGCLIARSQIHETIWDVAVPVGIEGTDIMASLAVPLISPTKTAPKAASKILKMARDAAKAINTALGC